MTTRTIRRNAKHKIAAIADAYTEMTSHMLANDFEPYQVWDNAVVWDELFAKPGARLLHYTGSDMYEIRIHKDRFYRLTRPPAKTGVAQT